MGVGMDATRPRRARRVLVLGACAAIGVLAVAVAPGGVAADPQAQAAGAVKVSIGDNFFSPVKARVNPLGKVKWTNNGKVQHNVTFQGGGSSGNLGPGESFVKKFNRAGKFLYSCTIHPGMTGKVKVVAGG
jgi:plastocyanin